MSLVCNVVVLPMRVHAFYPYDISRGEL
uniref:Uncharacterized protein n=1 Tax=Heterorhabditis bacteriophora TaxID=37862 RepID=A0A1I7WTB4_HETBA